MMNIFVAATGVYDGLLAENDRIESYNLVFPGTEKRFILMSDRDITGHLREILCDDYREILYYHICNLVYPYVTLHKFDYIADCIGYLGIGEDERFIYSDACSIMTEKEGEYWKQLDAEMGEYGLLFARNPGGRLCASECDPRSKHHLTREYILSNLHRYCQASFLMGTMGSLKAMLTHINQYSLDDIRYTGDDRRKNIIIPNFCEQHYMNYFIREVTDGRLDPGFRIRVDEYMTESGRPIADRAFNICHFRRDAVFRKRSATVYRYED